MILYVNGDSNSAGAELRDKKKSWASLLAQTLDFELVNSAKGGASNDRILRTTQEFLHGEPKNIFVIIGWTSWEREEWLYQNNYYDVNASGHQSLPEGIAQVYKQWVTEQDDRARETKSKQYHARIYDLHQQLTSQQIPHLFFNALMPFQHADQTDWNHCYLGPYQNELSYYWYLKQHGFEPTRDNHYLEAAQPVWSNVLYKYIKENQIL